MASIHLQHELTSEEIRRDRAKQAAISRNREQAAIKRKKHGTREMTEMRHFNDPASNSAKSFFEQLLTECAIIAPDVHQVAAPWWDGVKEAITKSDISTAINRMKIRIEEAKSKASTPTPVTSNIVNSMRGPVTSEDRRAARDKFADVPDGYYAVMTDNDELAFYRVSTWDKSGDRKVQVQASDALHLIRGWKTTDTILAKIRTATPEVAGLRYANEIGRCWRCGRTLTKTASRDRGMGADCASKY